MSAILCTLLVVTLSVAISRITVQAFRVVLDKAGATHEAFLASNVSSKASSNASSRAKGDAGFPQVTKWNGDWKGTWLPDAVGLHYFVHHGRSCDAYYVGRDGRGRRYSEGEQERLGCFLRDFGFGTDVGHEQEVHWNLVHWTNGLYYETLSHPGNENVSTFFATEYRMPDYCSRAIISELSTVYSRGRRQNSLLAALLNRSSVSSDCSEFYSGSQMNIHDVHNRENARVLGHQLATKSCWNLCSDYRSLYCLGYQHCALCPDSSDHNCHLNPTLVDCCTKAYAKRIGRLVGLNPSGQFTGTNLPPIYDVPDRGLIASGSRLLSGKRS